MAITFTNGKKNGGAQGKRPKRALPVSDGDCPKGGKHMYQMYGAPYEVCVKCGKQHDSIIDWRNAVIVDSRVWDHPYTLAGIWSPMEYKRYMSMKK